MSTLDPNKAGDAVIYQLVRVPRSFWQWLAGAPPAFVKVGICLRCMRTFDKDGNMRTFDKDGNARTPVHPQLPWVRCGHMRGR